MGKRRQPGGRRTRNISISGILDAEVEKHLTSPVTGEVPYGAYSQLVTDLLVKWLQDKKLTKLEDL